jgi:hypothetical protein
MKKTLGIILTHDDLNILLEGKLVERLSNMGRGNMEVQITLQPAKLPKKKRKNDFLLEKKQDEQVAFGG